MSHNIHICYLPYKRELRENNNTFLSAEKK
jgi:hypothetical protein